MKQTYFIGLSAAVICMLAVIPATAQQSTSYEVEYQAPQSYKDFRFSVGGGYAFRLGKIEKTGDSKLDELNKQLRHGFAIDADAQYFFKEGWGLGLNMNYCSSSTSGGNINLPPPTLTIIRNYKESQNILFVGPSFAGRSEFSKFLLVSSVAIGPMFYKDKINFDDGEIYFNRTVFGFNAGISGEYKLSGNVGIGVKLSYTLGTIYFDSLYLDGQKVGGDKQNISSLMLTAFLSFRTW